MNQLRRWVLESFKNGTWVSRWECDGLEDKVVEQHLGSVPEGLAPVSEVFFGYLAQRYGFRGRWSDYDEVVIGTERVEQ